MEHTLNNDDDNNYNRNKALTYPARIHPLDDLSSGSDRDVPESRGYHLVCTDSFLKGSTSGAMHTLSNDDANNCN